MFFMENQDHVPELKYTCHTVKKLMMQRIFLAEKRECETSEGWPEQLFTHYYDHIWIWDLNLTLLDLMQCTHHTEQAFWRKTNFALHRLKNVLCVGSSGNGDCDDLNCTSCPSQEGGDKQGESEDHTSVTDFQDLTKSWNRCIALAWTMSTD